MQPHAFDPAPPILPRRLTLEELGSLSLGKDPGARSLAWVYFGFGGRIPRRTFWRHGVLALLLLAMFGNALMDIAGLQSDAGGKFVNLLLAWPFVAISAKRLHDFNCSGWWMLVNIVPVVGSIATLLVNGAVPGTRGPNRHGEPPADKVEPIAADPVLDALINSAH